MNFVRHTLHQIHAGRCLWCNCRTKLSKPPEFGLMKNNASTIDHLINNLDKPDELQNVIVNACYGCNQKRGVEANRHQAAEVRKARLERDKALYREWLRQNIKRTAAVDIDREKEQRATA